VRQAAGRTVEVASDNRLAIIGLTLAAGLGVGLLLPIGQRPRRALRRAGERVWNEAEQLARRGVGTQRGRGFDRGEYDMADLTVPPSGAAY
jgi:hypothetical protein